MIKILNEIIDSYKDEMVQSLQEYVRIKSVVKPPEGNFPFGEDVQRAFEYIMNLAQAKGFTCKNYDNYAGDITLGEYPYIGAALHTDVVPEGDGWTVEPYGGEVIDGKIYGRGTIDNKGCAIAVLYAMLAIKESGQPLSKGIRMIVGNCEESGQFPCIRYYMDKTALPECGIVPDAMFPAIYAEKSFCTFSYKKEFDQSRLQADGVGIRLLKAEGGTAANVVPSSAYAEFRIEGRKEPVKVFFEGVSAHASKPELGVNAISKMLAFLEHVEFEPVEVAETLKMLSVRTSYDTDGRGMGIDFSDDTGDLTSNIGLLHYEDGILETTVNLRCPVRTAQKTLEDRLKENARQMGMEYILVNYNPHFYVDKDGELMNKLLGVYRNMTGDFASQPVAHGAGSYARVMKNFIPFGPVAVDEEVTFHKPDEHISIDKLVEITKIYAQALYELSK